MVGKRHGYTSKDMTQKNDRTTILKLEGRTETKTESEIRGKRDDEKRKAEK
jgi:hypothetical protein